MTPPCEQLNEENCLTEAQYKERLAAFSDEIELIIEFMDKGDNEKALHMLEQIVARTNKYINE